MFTYFFNKTNQKSASSDKSYPKETSITKIRPVSKFIDLRPVPSPPNLSVHVPGPRIGAVIGVVLTS